MLLQIGAFVAGLVALYFGAEWLVRGSARLARSMGISALVVGLTVVAFGTSAPELIVSLIAALREQPGVAIGNVVGSNIANIALILGIAAMIHPMRAEIKLILREMPIMILSGILLAVMALDGQFSRLDGALLVTGLFAYLGLMLRVARREPATSEIAYAGFEDAEAMTPHGESRLWDLTLLLLGLATLAGGAHLLVTSAIAFARALGVSELVIGLTIVAVGTSLPELATSAIAALRREADIALGNIVGSNIFNVLAILGVTALVHPIPVERTMFRFEIPVMLVLSMVLPFFGLTRLRVERWEGALLVASYFAFVGWLIRGAIGV
ncbi:MAG TPA: calcium/sodium antiporter [Gemmatimonadaceae bacterium]|nr:calcium/sodium antiporter [Gemmatimonadaceae bacterium]